MITVEGRLVPWHPQITLAEVLESLDLAGLVVVVRLNGRLVSKPDFASTPVPDGAHIDPLPLIAGG